LDSKRFLVVGFEQSLKVGTNHIRRAMKSKKIVGLAAALGLALSAFTGAAPAQAEDKIITVWADETRGANLTSVLGTVAKQSGGEWVDGYKIKVVAYSSFDALKAAVDAVTKDGPDIIVGANDWVSTGAANGKLAAFTPSASLRSQFSAGNWFDLTYKGKIYGVPVDVNNVAMLVNTKLTGGKKPSTFGDMVNVYKANKTSKKLTAGLCIAAGGTSWGAHSIASALGANAYVMKNGKVDTKADPINVAAVTANVKQYLLGANGKTNGFLPATDTGCKTNFLAGKVPYAIIGNWEWLDYSKAGFSMNNLMGVPGVRAGTVGAAFGSVNVALLTSFAETNGNDAAAKSLLTKFFGSTAGQITYQGIEKRPPANKNAAAQAGSAQKAFAAAATKNSIPQIGALLAPAGTVSYWEALPAFWTDVLVKNVDPKTAVTKLRTVYRKNIEVGAKNL
jgi:arabinogalactan oligomer/maltooligosaccharide transport system substrate-binding protein